jgi:prephenate dehydrogenase
MGANVVAVPPGRHDDLVALLSHVPHLTAATLMNLAVDASSEHTTLLRLAAGGFRDMTRIAAGHPGIWPDLCVDNRDAILAVLDELAGALAGLRRIVDEGDQAALLGHLERARSARVSLPTGAPPAGETAEVRVRIADRPGTIAEVTTLFSDLGVNIYDIEVTHSAEGTGGVLVLVVDAAAVETVHDALRDRKHTSSVQRPAL